jgi:hypothetical protein
MAAEGAPANVTATSVEVIPRDEFVREFGSTYKPGQHLTMIGPTQRGKSYLARQLLGRTISPQHRATILLGKPPGRDPGMESSAKQLGLRKTTVWPPERQFGDRKVNGWLLQPKQEMRNVDADNANLKAQFRAALMGNYATDARHPRIILVDETHLVQNDLGLKKEYEAPLMRGAPHCAVWSLVQRGRYISYHAYCEPEHLFIFYDPDPTNRQRYADIGGIDPNEVLYLTETLQLQETPNGQTISEALYIRRSGPQMAIVAID